MSDDRKLVIVHWVLGVIIAAAFVARGEPDIAAGVLLGLVVSMVWR